MAPRGRPSRPRRSVTRDAVQRDILVFAEGERTEVDYLRDWHRIHRARVNVSIDPRHAAPRQLIDYAADAQREDARDARRGRGRPYDEVWCCDRKHDLDGSPPGHNPSSGVWRLVDAIREG